MSPREYVSHPNDITVNGPCIVLYYDDELFEMDGAGWCFEAYPGSSTFRFESFAQLMEFASVDYNRQQLEVRLTQQSDKGHTNQS